MNRLKRYIALVLIAAMTLTAAACGKKEKPAPVRETPAAETEAKAAETEAKEAKTEETKAEAETKAAETAAEAEKQSEKKQPADGGKVRNLGIFIDETGAGLYKEASYEWAIDLTFHGASLSDEDAAEYPELQNALEAFSEDQEDEYVKIFGDLSESWNEDLRDREQFAPESGMYLSDTADFHVMRADTRMVSLFADRYAYYGGVHPDALYMGWNFDTETGKELALTDVISDTDAFLAYLAEKIDADYPEDREAMTPIPEFVKSTDLSVNAPMTWSWAMDGDGITMYFNEYCLGPYAMGPVIEKVYYGELPAVFDEYYVKHADNYVLPLGGPGRIMIDTDGDGEAEEVRVIEVPADEEAYSFYYTVSCEGKEVTVEDWSYSEEHYAARLGDRYYLFLFERTDNDYILMRVVDLKDMKIVDPDEYYGYNTATLWYIYDDEEMGGIYSTRSREAALTDPEDMLLSERFDALSTMNGYRHCRLTPEGVKTDKDDPYICTSGLVLKTKQDVKACVVDENGEVTDADAMIPEGTYLMFVRTNAESWVDLQAVDPDLVDEQRYDGIVNMSFPDGRPEVDYDKPVFRVLMDKSEWPYTVNEIDETELFDGIVYAG